MNTFARIRGAKATRNVRTAGCLSPSPGRHVFLSAGASKTACSKALAVHPNAAADGPTKGARRASSARFASAPRNGTAADQPNLESNCHNAVRRTIRPDPTIEGQRIVARTRARSRPAIGRPGAVREMRGSASRTPPIATAVSTTALRLMTPLTNSSASWPVPRARCSTTTGRKTTAREEINTVDT